MARKDFAKNLKRDTRSMKPVPAPEPVSDSETSSQDPVPAEGVPAPEKKKRGRPKVKTAPERTINISVPVEILEKMEIAKCCYGNNLTRYVNAVIKADLDARLEEYKKVKQVMDSYK